MPTYPVTLTDEEEAVVTSLSKGAVADFVQLMVTTRIAILIPGYRRGQEEAIVAALLKAEPGERAIAVALALAEPRRRAKALQAVQAVLAAPDDPVPIPVPVPEPVPAPVGP
jgi:hypothetical protein